MPHMQVDQSRLIGGNATHYQAMGSGIGQQINSGHASYMSPMVNNSFSMDGADESGADMAVAGSRMLQEYQTEIARLRHQTSQLLYHREIREKDFENVMYENQTLNSKLENLENVFIG